VLLLPADDGRRVGLRRRQVAAVGRAGDLDEALGTAANGADLAAQGRARAPGRTLATERALHRGSLPDRGRGSRAGGRGKNDGWTTRRDAERTP
jgi:hypothetical protein